MFVLCAASVIGRLAFDSAPQQARIEFNCY
jgi:hypothetical protein